MPGMIDTWKRLGMFLGLFVLCGTFWYLLGIWAWEVLK